MGNSSSRKGTDNERKGAERLRDEYGYEYVHNSAGGRFDKDIFDWADLIAMNPGEEKIKFVQVKTNGANGIQQYEKEASELFPHPFADFELWVRHDGVGGPHGKSPAWREHRLTEDGFEKIRDEREEFDGWDY